MPTDLHAAVLYGSAASHVCLSFFNRLSRNFFSALQEVRPKQPTRLQLDFRSTSKPPPAASKAPAAKRGGKTATAGKGRRKIASAAAEATEPVANGSTEANGTINAASSVRIKEKQENTDEELRHGRWQNLW